MAASTPIKTWPGTIAILACLSAALAGTTRAETPAPFKVPDEIGMPSGPDGAAINLGKTLINDTKKKLPDNVGNGLTCSNCHLGAGTVALAGPFVGLGGMFPEFNARDRGIDSLQERINDCFVRSMNGKALAWNSRR